jgi:DNA-directed RNA polymerase subunit RPC12/RpoP
MSNLTNAVCFTCGLVIESPPRLSRLTNGQVCPACRERVLEDLPPALPSRSREATAGSEPETRSSETTAPGDPDSEPGPGRWDRAS